MNHLAQGSIVGNASGGRSIRHKNVRELMLGILGRVTAHEVLCRIECDAEIRHAVGLDLFDLVNKFLDIFIRDLHEIDDTFNSGIETVDVNEDIDRLLHEEKQHTAKCLFQIMHLGNS